MAESTSWAGLRLLAPVDAELSARISWLIRLRGLAVVGSFVAILLTSIILPHVLPVVPLAIVTGFVGLYNIGFYIYTRSARFRVESESHQAGLARFVYVQIALDLVCLTFLLHFAGGIENPFWTFYVLHIIVASILLSRRAAFAFAALATVLYVGLIVLEYLGVVPHVNLVGIIGPAQYREVNLLIVTALAFIATLFFAALVATAIMERLRARDSDLLQCCVGLDARSQELVEMNRRLAEFHELRNRFIVVLTHDLRAPVAAIQGFLRLFLSGSLPPDKQREVIVRAEARATELLDRTANVLILSEIREKLTKTEEVDLGAVLLETIEAMQGAIEQKQLYIQTNLDPQTPCLTANREQIAQIWMNLVSNAIKYTPRGGRIELSLTYTEDTLIGSVRDTGIGIEPEDQTRIFQEFFRSSAAKRVEPYGTGLGLAIVKQIVEGYGGRIEVTSTPGQGAMFTVFLPRRRASCAPA